MKNILLIGTSMQDYIFMAEEIHPNHCNKGTFTSNFGGSMHNVSYNLGCLGCNPIFITKIGNDSKATELQDELSLLGVELHTILVDKPTPVFQSIHADNVQYFLSSITPDFLFNEQDSIDYSLFKDSFAITDQMNEKFLYDLFHNTSSTRWIISGFIPSVELLRYIEGIVVNVDEFEEEKMDFSTGLQWVIVTEDKNGATLYTRDGKVPIKTNIIETNNDIGAGDAFLAGLLYGLVRNLTLIDSIQLAHRAAQIILQTPSAISKELQKLKSEN
ncbi:MAG: PfkB family carbohydrate kinase [Erysipelotrichaceae bacterium]